MFCAEYEIRVLGAPPPFPVEKHLPMLATEKGSYCLIIPVAYFFPLAVLADQTLVSPRHSPRLSQVVQPTSSRTVLRDLAPPPPSPLSPSSPLSEGSLPLSSWPPLSLQTSCNTTLSTQQLHTDCISFVVLYEFLSVLHEQHNTAGMDGQKNIYLHT